MIVSNASSCSSCLLKAENSGKLAIVSVNWWMAVSGGHVFSFTAFLMASTSLFAIASWSDWCVKFPLSDSDPEKKTPPCNSKATCSASSSAPEPDSKSSSGLAIFGFRLDDVVLVFGQEGCKSAFSSKRNVLGSCKFGMRHTKIQLVPSADAWAIDCTASIVCCWWCEVDIDSKHISAGFTWTLKTFTHNLASFAWSRCSRKILLRSKKS